MPDKNTVILADGEFPTAPEALAVLKSAHRIICCDGAAENLLSAGFEPAFIVGDLDSLSGELKTRFSDRLIHVADQESNDLTKAFNFCRSNSWSNISILGATGKREDHTLGNLSLLGAYARQVSGIKCITNYGVFQVVSASGVFSSYPGQQVSLIALTPQAEVSSSGLKYPLAGLVLNNWWQATLNEATGESFALTLAEGVTLLLFKEHKHE